MRLRIRPNLIELEVQSFFFLLLKSCNFYLHQKINDLRRHGTLFPLDLPVCRYWSGFLVVYCNACLYKK